MSLILWGCEENGDAFDMKMTSLSKTSVGVKNIDTRKLEGCVVLLNGAGGFWHEPERSEFNKGESRIFSLARFYSVSKRQFDYKVDSISRISVDCKKPQGTALVFETNQGSLGFLE
ncbi:hypothetical protein [Kiloniella majae]|uniref:hypothetical protein n=1 Tax=Kiloniella majae TaxID=1938558 RepID=UPI000A2797D0|nr:hypothetical protein [Kiloniella majae]